MPPHPTPTTSSKEPYVRVSDEAYGISRSVLLLKGAKTFLNVSSKCSRFLPGNSSLLCGSSTSPSLPHVGIRTSSSSKSHSGMRYGDSSLYRCSHTSRVSDHIVAPNEHATVRPRCRLAARCAFGASNHGFSARTGSLFGRCQALWSACHLRPGEIANSLELPKC